MFFAVGVVFAACAHERMSLVGNKLIMMISIALAVAWLRRLLLEFCSLNLSFALVPAARHCLDVNEC